MFALELKRTPLPRRVRGISLPLHHVGNFRDKRAILQVARQRIPPLVVNEEEIAERTMDDVEANVGTPRPGIAVVLHECVQEHRCRKRIIDARADEVRLVMAIREADVVMGEIDCRIEVMVYAQRLIHRVCVFISCVEPPHTYTESRPIALGTIRSVIQEVFRHVVYTNWDDIVAVV